MGLGPWTSPPGSLIGRTLAPREKNKCRIESGGLGRSVGPKPYKFIGLGDIHGPKPYKFIGFGDRTPAAQSGPAKNIGFMLFDTGPGGGPGAPGKSPRAIRRPPGGPRDLKQTKTKNLET